MLWYFSAFRRHFLDDFIVPLQEQNPGEEIKLVGGPVGEVLGSYTWSMCQRAGQSTSKRWAEPSALAMWRKASVEDSDLVLGFYVVLCGFMMSWCFWLSWNMVLGWMIQICLCKKSFTHHLMCWKERHSWALNGVFLHMIERLCCEPVDRSGRSLQVYLWVSRQGVMSQGWLTLEISIFDLIELAFAKSSIYSRLITSENEGLQTWGTQRHFDPFDYFDPMEGWVVMTPQMRWGWWGHVAERVWGKDSWK